MVDICDDSADAFLGKFFDMDFEVFEDFNVKDFSFPDASCIASKITTQC